MNRVERRGDVIYRVTFEVSCKHTDKQLSAWRWQSGKAISYLNKLSFDHQKRGE